MDKKKTKIITLSLGELSSWGIFHQRITEGYFQSFSVQNGVVGVSPTDYQG